MKWILFVFQRFSSADRHSRGSINSVLAAVCIAFGVMALITVVSVMNGFQMQYIDSIMELSSGHIRVTNLPDDKRIRFESFLKNESEIKAYEPFYEGQSLIASGRGRQQGALIRAVPNNILVADDGFASEMKMIDGTFDISESYHIVLGSGLAYSLGVEVGDSVTLLAMSGDSDVNLIDKNRVFYVTGIFSCGYSDINSTFAFVSQNTKNQLFGSESQPIYCIKLFKDNDDARVIKKIQTQFPQASYESWRSYNRAFFGALRVEKNMLMTLVFLIFVVVAVNIYNGMRRIVYERREDICVFSALGAPTKSIQAVFILQGLVTGFLGALSGTSLGLLLCVNIDKIFMFFAHFSDLVRYVTILLFSPQTAEYMHQNSLYALYAKIPARVVFSEVMLICLFGVFSSFFASLCAGRRILKLSIAEVLRDE